MKGFLSDRLQVTLAFFLTALSITFGGGSAAAQAAGDLFSFNPSQAIIDYPRDPDTVVVSFTEILGEIGDADQAPSVRVYGDGYTVVHYPPYMKRAGDYALQLTQDEMDSLLQSLIGKNVLVFDANAVRQSKREAAAAAAKEELQPTLFAVSDASTTVIEIRLDRYKPAGGLGQEILNVHKKISWHGLRWDARRYPNIDAIQNLAAAQQELQAFMQRQDLEKIQ